MNDTLLKHTSPSDVSIMGFDCKRIRKDFPELSNGELVYLDSAASSLKPFSVINTIKSFMESSYSNVHRGVYEVALKATMLYEEAHEKVAEFLKTSSKQVVFTPQGTTTALHRAALLIYQNIDIPEGSTILVTGDSHNSNLLPWIRLAQWTKTKIRILPLKQNGIPYWERINEYIDETTRIIAVTHISNVTGYKAPLEEIVEKAGKHGSIIVLDAAQSIPHIPVDLSKLDVDFVAFNSHKMLGPTGLGILWINNRLVDKLEPALGGGGTVKDVKPVNNEIKPYWDEPPYKFEPGTPPIIEAVGLKTAIEYLEDIGMEKVAKHEEKLVEEAMEALSRHRRVEIIGSSDPREHSGIITFTIENTDPDAIGLKLGSMNIAVRTGTHCANTLYHYIKKAERKYKDKLLRIQLYGRYRKTR